MPSFAEALYSLPTEKLRKLIQVRGVDPRKLTLDTDKRTLAQHVAGELNRQQSVEAAILQCDARELRLLQIVASFESTRGFEWSTLLEKAGGRTVETAVASVLSRLEQLGLAFRVGDSVYVPDMVRQVAPGSLSDRYKIARLLNSYDAPAIRRILSNIGLDAEYTTTKNINVESIVGHLIRNLPDLRLNPPLSTEELNVLEFLVQMGGSATPIEVATVVLDGRTDDFFRYEWQNRWKQGKERNAVDNLLGRGIVHVITSGYGYNFYLVIPGDLLHAIVGANVDGFWTDPAPVPKPTASDPHKSARNNLLLRDVVCMLSFFAVSSATRTNTGHIHKASLKAVSRMLGMADEQYAAFLYAIVRDTGLAEPQGERQIYTLTARGADWLQWDSASQLRALFEAWRNGVTWGEMYTDPLARYNEYRNKNAVVPARNAVLELLANIADTSAFIDLDSAATALNYRRPLLLSECATASTGVSTSLSSYVVQIIAESLFWLGLVELGAERAPESVQAPESMPVTAFRLTPEILALLLPESGPLPEPPPREDKFLVQANSEIFVPPYLDPWILYRLLMLTDIPVKGGFSNTVLLTRESIRRSLDLGETPSEMLQFLREHSRTGVPQNVEYLINEVGGKHGHIHVGRAEMYLQVDSPLLMKELQVRRELKGYFVRALTDTVAILNCTDIEKLLKELRKAGYLPVSDEAKMVRPSTGPPGRAAHSSPPGGVKKPGAAKRDALDNVDWQRIARDDEKPWNTHSSSAQGDLSKPQGAYDNPSLIRVMMHNACITHNVIDLVFRELGCEPIRMLFQPVNMAGNAVQGYGQYSDELLSLDLDKIRWARLTPEKY